jgi:hypothetical protein
MGSILVRDFYVGEGERNPAKPRSTGTPKKAGNSILDELEISSDQPPQDKKTNFVRTLTNHQKFVLCGNY